MEDPKAPSKERLAVARWWARQMLDPDWRALLKKKGELELPFGVRVAHYEDADADTAEDTEDTEDTDSHV